MHKRTHLQMKTRQFPTSSPGLIIIVNFPLKPSWKNTTRHIQWLKKTYTHSRLNLKIINSLVGALARPFPFVESTRKRHYRVHFLPPFPPFESDFSFFFRVQRGRKMNALSFYSALLILLRDCSARSP